VGGELLIRVGPPKGSGLYERAKQVEATDGQPPSVGIWKNKTFDRTADPSVEAQQGGGKEALSMRCSSAVKAMNDRFLDQVFRNPAVRVESAVKSSFLVVIVTPSCRAGCVCDLLLQHSI